MHNPGSVLQAWALQEYINNQGHNCYIIDYRPHYFYSEGNGLKHFIKKTVFHRDMKSRSIKFDSFINSNMRLTPTYYTVAELEAEASTADITIAGSDQLWNTDFQCGKDDAFYLDFVKSGKKASYSTSVGKKNLDANNLRQLEKKLPLFDFISVREKSTAEALSFLLNREVSFVCDPVLLFSSNRYKQFVLNNRPIDDKYVMVYLAPKSPALESLVNLYSEQGYKVILVGGFSKRCKCDCHIKDAGPLDFLTYLYYSDAVISNSFHATAFSLLFHKQFWSILPERNSERIESLLSIVNLKHRGIDDTNDSVDMNTSIDWDDVDFNLNQYVEESILFLNQVLSEVVD